MQCCKSGKSFSAITRVAPARRQSVWRELSSVIEAKSSDAFEELFQKLVARWAEDNETKSFSEYIKREYATKKEAIGKCYRNQYRINVNMYLESFHKQLKYRYDIFTVPVKTLLSHLFCHWMLLQMSGQEHEEPSR